MCREIISIKLGLRSKQGKSWSGFELELVGEREVAGVSFARLVRWHPSLLARSLSSLARHWFRPRGCAAVTSQFVRWQLTQCHLIDHLARWIESIKSASFQHPKSFFDEKLIGRISWLTIFLVFRWKNFYSQWHGLLRIMTLSVQIRKLFENFFSFLAKSFSSKTATYKEVFIRKGFYASWQIMAMTWKATTMFETVPVLAGTLKS